MEKDDIVASLIERAQLQGVSARDNPKFKRDLQQIWVAEGRYIREAVQAVEKSIEDGTYLIEEAARGDYPFAQLIGMGKKMIREPAIFALNFSDTTKQVVIIGGQGSGKSMLALQKAFRGLVRNVTPHVIFSPRKDFAVLAKLFPNRVHYVRWSDLPINPIYHGALQNEDVYRNGSVEIIKETGSMIASEAVLKDIMDRAVGLGITTWRDFVPYAFQLKPKELGTSPAWLDNVKRKIKQLDNQFKTVFGAIDNTHLQRIRKAGKSLVINTFGVQDEGYIQKLFLHAYTCPIIEEIDASTQHSTENEVDFIFDESQNALLKKDPNAQYVRRLIRMTCRAYRIGIMPIAHNLRGIDGDSLNLAGTKVIMACGEQDLLMVRETLGNAYPLAKELMPREAWVLLRERIRQPLKIRTFNSPASFFEIPDPQFLEEQSSKFRKSVPLVQEHLPVEIKSTSPVPQQQADELARPTEQDNEQNPLAKLTPRHYVIIELCRRLPFSNLKNLIDQAAKLPKNDRIASAQTFRKYMNELISIQFFQKVLLPRKKGKNSVFLWPGPVGQVYYLEKYKTCIGGENPSGSGKHTISIHLLAENERQLYPDATIVIGDTKTPRRWTENIGELDLVVTMQDGRIFLTEVDYHARNLTTDRLRQMLDCIPNVVSLRIVCFPKDLVNKKQLEQLDTRISVQPISDFVD